jgi:hypothetical protein
LLLYQFLRQFIISFRQTLRHSYGDLFFAIFAVVFT